MKLITLPIIRYTQHRARGLLVAVLFSILLLVFLACGSSSQSSSSGSSVEIDGSSTVFPITEAVAEEFQKVNPDVRVNVGVSGTGGGFKRFIRGETDISDASRPIKDSEAQAAAANGIEFIELRVALDGLSVVVSPQNDFVECLCQVRDLGFEELLTVREGVSTGYQYEQSPCWIAPHSAILQLPTWSGAIYHQVHEVLFGGPGWCRA